MKRATLAGKCNCIIEEIEEPHAGPGQVRLAIQYVGICGSDLHAFKDEHPTLKGQFPNPMGHEYSGIIDEIGDGVTGFKIGAPATVQPVINCGKCKWCLEEGGNLALCAEEKFYSGAATKYYVADASHIVQLADDTDLKDAAMIEPLAVAVHGVKLVPDIKGKNVLVTGGGAIGNLTAQVARQYGAAKVFVSDLMEERLEIAKKLGFIPINPLKDDFEAKLKEFTGEKKVGVSFECAGSEKSLANCVELTESRGVVILLAVFAKKPVVDMFRIEDRELRVFGAYQYTPEDFTKAVRLVESKNLDLGILRGKEFDLDEVQECFEWTEKNPNACIKVMLKI